MDSRSFYSLFGYGDIDCGAMIGVYGDNDDGDDGDGNNDGDGDADDGDDDGVHGYGLESFL